VPVFGLIFTTGVALLVFDLLTMGHRAGAGQAAEADLPAVVAHPALAGTGWRRRLSGWEAGLWLLGMWIFGAVITMGLLSFNLSGVRGGSPLFPYLMAGIGYPGLFLVTLFFVWRFLSSLNARSGVPMSARSSTPPAVEPAE
jgi:nitric oxide reductase subunit B